jgi:hypothetical protein
MTMASAMAMAMKRLDKTRHTKTKTTTFPLSTDLPFSFIGPLYSLFWPNQKKVRKYKNNQEYALLLLDIV